eukprot:12909783-Heterocapsa_arctica.AAC.1
MVSRALGTRFDAVVLKTSPNATSVGHFCVEYNWWFKWPPSKPPYFTKLNGDIEYVTAVPADEIEGGDGAVEVIEIPPEDRALGEVGGSPPMDGLPGNEEEPKSDRDLKADALSRERLLTHLTNSA